MKAKLNSIGKIVKWGISALCLLSQKITVAQTSSENVSEAGLSYSPYLTVSLALLLTFLTVFAISMLARYIRENTGDPFNGFKDSDN